MLKTTLSTSQDARTSLEDLLPDVWSTPISPRMPSPREILHNRMIQCPNRPSTAVNTHHKKKTWKQYFEKAYNVKPILQLDLTRKYCSCPKLTNVLTFLGPSLTEPLPHEVTTLKPKSRDTAGLGNTSVPSNRASSPGTQYSNWAHKHLSPAAYHIPPLPLEHSYNPLKWSPDHRWLSP